MSGWETLNEKIDADGSLRALTRDELEGVVDILGLAILADGRVTPIEAAALRHVLSGISGMEERSAEVAECIQAASHRIRAAADEPARSEVARRAAARLTRPDLREAVYTLAVLLVAMDETVETAEAADLTALAALLGIPDARAREILDLATEGDPPDDDDDPGAP